MNVSKTEIVLRERRFWESLDLAGPMYRRWIGPILIFFGAPLLAVTVALLFYLIDLRPWLPALVIWWLKPLWDRLVMVPAGVLMFQPGAGGKVMAGSLKRIATPSLAADLTWRRFSPLRAYLIPVPMYERPGRREGSKRRRWLRHNAFWKLAGITVLCIGLEGVVALSLGLTYTAMTSVSVMAFGSASVHNTALFYNVIYAAVVLIVEPFYVLVCFSMYVNRRTSAEGWDLQLAFSRLRSKLPVTGGKVLFAVFLLVLSLQAVAVNADQGAVKSSSEQQSAFVQRAKKVLSGNEFGRTIVRHRLKLKKGLHLGGLFEGGRGNPLLNRLSAQALRVIAAAIALGLITLGIIVNRRRIAGVVRSFGRPKRTNGQALPARSGHIDVTGWIDAGRREWDRGRFRDAMGIIYRGSLDVARKRSGARISDSATERECLRILKDSDAPSTILEAVKEVTETWILLAWAGKIPERPAFDQLCRTLTEIGRSK